MTGKRNKTADQILDLLADGKEHARPDWCTQSQWTYHLRRLAAKGCLVVRRKQGRKTLVRADSQHSSSEWRKAVDDSLVARGYISPKDAAPRLSSADAPKRRTFAVIQQGSGWVEVAGVSEGDLPFPVQLRVARASDGRLVVTNLNLGSREKGKVVEITARGLRQLPLRAILDEVAQSTSSFEGIGLVSVPAVPAESEHMRRRPGPRGPRIALDRELLTQIRRDLPGSPAR